ncbi:MAG: hypothetical protein ACE5H0_00415 [Bacteroidota bacterium]
MHAIRFRRISLKVLFSPTGIVLISTSVFEPVRNPGRLVQPFIKLLRLEHLLPGVGVDRSRSTRNSVSSRMLDTTGRALRFAERVAVDFAHVVIRPNDRFRETPMEQRISSIPSFL